MILYTQHRARHTQISRWDAFLISGTTNPGPRALVQADTSCSECGPLNKRLGHPTPPSLLQGICDQLAIRWSSGVPMIL
jgi:hypothetical protein